MKVTVVTASMNRPVSAPFVSVVKGTIDDELKLKITKFLMTDPTGDVQFTEMETSDLKADLLDCGLQRFPSGNAGYINQENLENGIIQR